MIGVGERETADSGANEHVEAAPEDFYYEGPLLIFTEAYHRKRGYCCNSGCRHCPYQEP